MERLIYHSNPNPTKLHFNLNLNLNLNFNLKPYPFLPRIDAQKPFSSSSSSSPSSSLSSSTAGSRRLISVFCKREDLSSNYSRSSSAEFPDNYSVKSSSLSLSPAELPDGSMRKPRFLAQTVSRQRKAVAGGTVILLSVIFMTLLHPLFASPAFAAFQNAAAKTGRFARSELLSSAWTGFFAGCLHTLSGPDHLAALAPLSIGRTRMESAAVGALWGCGHDAGQVIFGLLFLLLKDKLHIEVIRTWGTRVVGFTLLVIGGMGIREASEIPTPCVALENGECDVSGTYESAPSPFDNPAVGKKKKIGFATFATGIVHGLQPDALMMVLPALALPSRLAGAAFLGMFLVGTVIAMGSYTVFIGSCSEALKERVPRITEKLTWVSSLIAIALGFAILISQFFGFSLY